MGTLLGAEVEGVTLGMNVGVTEGATVGVIVGIMLGADVVGVFDGT